MTDAPPSPEFGYNDFLKVATHRPVRVRHQESIEVAFIDRLRAMEVLKNELDNMKQRADWKTPLAVGVTVGIVIPITDWSWTEKKLWLNGAAWQRIFVIGLVVTVAWFLIAGVRALLWKQVTPAALYERLAGSEVSDLESGQLRHETGLLVAGPFTHPLRPSESNGTQLAPPPTADGPDAPEPQLGSRVIHPSHGAGTVRRLGIDDDTFHHTTIEFDDPGCGTRDLITSLTPLALVLDEVTGKPAFEKS